MDKLSYFLNFRKQGMNIPTPKEPVNMVPSKNFDDRLISLINQLNLLNKTVESNSDKLKDLAETNEDAAKLMEQLRSSESMRESALNKIIEKQELTTEEAANLVVSLETISDSLEKVDMSLDVKFKDVLENHKVLINDTRLDASMRKKYLAEIVSIADEAKVSSSAIDELKRVNLDQLKFSQKSNSEIATILSRISSQTDSQLITTRTSSRDYSKKMDKLLIHQRDLSHYLTLSAKTRGGALSGQLRETLGGGARSLRQGVISYGLQALGGRYGAVIDAMGGSDFIENYLQQRAMAKAAASGAARGVGGIAEGVATAPKTGLGKLLEKGKVLAPKLGGATKLIGKVALPLAAAMTAFEGIKDLTKGKGVDTAKDIIPKGFLGKINPFEWAMRGGMYAGGKVSKNVPIGTKVYDWLHPDNDKKYNEAIKKVQSQSKKLDTAEKEVSKKVDKQVDKLANPKKGWLVTISGGLASAVSVLTLNNLTPDQISRGFEAFGKGLTDAWDAVKSGASTISSRAGETIETAGDWLKGVKKGTGGLKWSKGWTPETEKMVESEAKVAGLDPAMMKTFAHIESRGNPLANRGEKSAQGLFQFIPSTAKKYGLSNRLNAVENTRAAMQLTKSNANDLKRFGIPVNPLNLYLAHQQGAGGLIQIYNNINKGTPISGQVRNNMKNNPPPGGDWRPNDPAVVWYTSWKSHIGSTYTKIAGDKGDVLTTSPSPVAKATKSTKDSVESVNSMLTKIKTPGERETYLKNVISTDIDPKIRDYAKSKLEEKEVVKSVNKNVNKSADILVNGIKKEVAQVKSNNIVNIGSKNIEKGVVSLVPTQVTPADILSGGKSAMTAKTNQMIASNNTIVPSAVAESVPQAAIMKPKEVQAPKIEQVVAKSMIPAPVNTASPIPTRVMSIDDYGIQFVKTMLFQ